MDNHRYPEPDLEFGFTSFVSKELLAAQTTGPASDRIDRVECFFGNAADVAIARFSTRLCQAFIPTVKQKANRTNDQQQQQIPNEHGRNEIGNRR